MRLNFIADFPLVNIEYIKEHKNDIPSEYGCIKNIEEKITNI